MRNYLLAILFSVAAFSVHAAATYPNQQNRQTQTKACDCDGCQKNCQCGCADGYGCHCQK